MKSFKKLDINLYQNVKTETQLSKDYGISLSAINKWVKQYSEIKTEDGDVFTIKYIKEIHMQNAKLEKKINSKKGDYNLHTILKQRLTVIY